MIVENAALKGLVHNGSAEATIDLATELTVNIVTRITIVSDGAGNIEWFVDGVSKGTSSAGPTGDSTNHAGLIQVEADNGGDAADQGISLHSIKIYVEQ